MIFKQKNYSNNKMQRGNGCRCNCGCGITASPKQYSLADKIRESISGKDGELSAVFTYLFQSFVVADEKLRGAIWEISQDEMEHAGKLSELLVMMKEEPYFIDSNKNFYTTKWVNYETDPKVFLKQNIESEKLAVKNYMDLIESTTDQNVIAVLMSIVDDERGHIEVFNRLLETVSANKLV